LRLNPGYQLDLSGRIVPVKRGRYKKLPLTKSAARLKSYLKLVTSKSKTGWATIDLHIIASYFQLSFRTIQRAKNSIESGHQLEFRTISNENGRRGHKLLVGAVDKIQNDVHQHNVAGKRRNIWQRIGSGKQVSLVQATSVSSSRRNQASTPPLPRNQSSKNKCLSPSFDGISEKSCSPDDAVFTSQPDDKIHPGTKDKDYHQKRHTPAWDMEKCFHRHQVVSKPASRNQIKLGHYIKKQCLSGIWDNCKVAVPTNAGGVFNWALKWIMKGGSINQMVKVFQLALEHQHRTATDVQLLTGQGVDYRFNISSTIIRADNLMCIHQMNGTMVVWSKDLVVTN
jgi:hypothetical protein